jgi:hypothetical protein
MAAAHPSVYSTKLKLEDSVPSLVISGSKFLKWTEVNFSTSTYNDRFNGRQNNYFF